jgi:hypothetical protein
MTSDDTKHNGGDSRTASTDAPHLEEFSAFQQGDGEAFDDNNDKGIMLGDLTAKEGAYFG